MQFAATKNTAMLLASAGAALGERGARLHNWGSNVNVQRAAAKSRTCASCGKKDGAQLKKCAGCKVLRFCGPECQREFWPKHKAACKCLRK